MRAPQVILAACMLLPALHAAEVRFVSQTGSDEYPYTSWETASRSIQTAVEAADPGDAIAVGPGEYAEQVSLKEGMVLFGSGAHRTRIAKPAGAAYAVAAPAGCEIRDVTVVGDAGTPGVGVVFGPGVGQVIARCAIRGLTCGISCESSSPGAVLSVWDTSVSGCPAAIYFWSPQGCLVVQGCTVKDGAMSIEGALGRVTGTLLEGSTFYTGHTQRLEIVRCRLSRTRIWAEGSAIVLANSLISEAETVVGMGYRCRAEVNACTVTGCGTLFEASEEANEIAVTNSIFWANSQRLSDTTVRVLVREVVCSDVEGGCEGGGNFDSDPLFRDPNHGDFHLTAQSPCIDAAECDPPAPYFHDLDGMPRPLYGGRYNPPPDFPSHADVGAYEYYINDVSLDPAGPATLTWSSWAQRSYSIFHSEDLVTWHLADGNVPSAGYMTTSWTDDGSLTGIPPSLVPRRFYRVLENP
jgi:hypothetical protein